ncbi:MAG: hypothetical protein KH291_08940, partial [Collinsella sp.]|nr:hypothetical protein [Collinsella sp.]
RFTQPETTQASQVEVPLGGLPPPVVALALRIRRRKHAGVRYLLSRYSMPMPVDHLIGGLFIKEKSKNLK